MVAKVVKVAAPKVVSDVLAWEVDPSYSRETGTLKAGSGSARKIEIGAVLGQISLGTATAVGAAVAGNTGNGTITASPTTSAGVKAGVYRLVCIEPATDAGKFAVEDPDGIVVGVATVGVAFTGGGLTFTIADATDFAAGDRFTVTVSIAAGSKKIVPIDFSATDGSQNVWGVSLKESIAADGEDLVNGVLAARRVSILKDTGLVWPEGATSDQKAAAIAQLAAMGVIVRAAV